MPLSHEEEFLSRLQQGNRIQIPVMIRMIHKLKAGEIIKVDIYVSGAIGNDIFYAKVSGDGRLVVPKVIIEKRRIEHKQRVSIKISPVKT